MCNINDFYLVKCYIFSQKKLQHYVTSNIQGFVYNMEHDVLHVKWHFSMITLHVHIPSIIFIRNATFQVFGPSLDVSDTKHHSWCTSWINAPFPLESMEITQK